MFISDPLPRSYFVYGFYLAECPLRTPLPSVVGVTGLWTA